MLFLRIKLESFAVKRLVNVHRNDSSVQLIPIVIVVIRKGSATPKMFKSVTYVKLGGLPPLPNSNLCFINN